jgi:hypothetical protein
MAAPTQVGVRMIVQSPYEGGTHDWSNRWFFNGPQWDNEAEFEAVADNLMASYRDHWLTPRNTIVEAIGTNPNSDVPVYTKSYGAAGTFAEQTNFYAPLQAAALVRFTTDQRTTKNHPIYLFKYLHAAQIESQAASETLRSGQRTGFQGEMDTLMGGISTASRIRKMCGPRGAVAQTALVETFLTHRDFLT